MTIKLKRREFLRGGVMAAIVAAMGIKTKPVRAGATTQARVGDVPPVSDLVDGPFSAMVWTQSLDGIRVGERYIDDCHTIPLAPLPFDGGWVRVSNYARYKEGEGFQVAIPLRPGGHTYTWWWDAEGNSRVYIDGEEA